jgi:hypothetical protein
LYAPSFEDFTNLCAHITNFSINRENADFKVTDDVAADGTGSKWSHVPFWPFLDSLGYDIGRIKNDIDGAVVTVIAAGRSSLLAQKNHRCSFEMWGFDILLDADGRIHVLEVNISPALGTSSSLDLHIKAPLVTDFFNLALIPKANAFSERVDGIFGVAEKRELAQFVAVLEMELADEAKGAFRRIYPTVERAKTHAKFLDEVTVFDKALARFLRMDAEKQMAYYRKMMSELDDYLEELLNCDNQTPQCNVF